MKRDGFITFALAILLGFWGPVEATDYELVPTAEAFDSQDISDMFDWRRNDESTEIKKTTGDEFLNLSPHGQKNQFAWSPNSDWLVLDNSKKESDEGLSLVLFNLKQQKVYSKNFDALEYLFKFKSENELLFFLRPDRITSDRMKWETFDLLMLPRVAPESVQETIVDASIILN